MQEVELVDVATDLPPALAADDLQAAAAQARRAARRRRLVRRWWPLPVVVAGTLVGTQVVLDARADDRVAARQQVPGVLRSVDPGLPALRHYDEAVASVVLSGVVVGDLRVGVASPPWDADRELVAVDRDGEPVWQTSLEDPSRAGPDAGMEYPVCVPDAEPVQVVRCLVLDRGTAPALDDSGVGTPTAPTGARLVALDAADGRVRETREVGAMSGWGGAGAVQVLASVTDDTLRVTAWDTAADRGGPDDPGARPLWRTDVELDGRGGTRPVYYPPGVTVTPERVLVQGDMGSWSLAAADGRLQAATRDYLSVSRTGHLLAPTGSGVRLVDDTGTAVAELDGMPLHLTVDDGTVPGVELLTTAGPGGRAISAVDVESGAEVWTAPHPLWTESSVVLLEGVLYGADQDAVWAVDAATGREVWRTLLDASADSALMTDGRHLLLVARPGDLAAVGLSAGAPAGEPVQAPDGGSRALAALDLATGAPAWATRLPEGVRGVWSWQDDLLGYGDEDITVLN
jgi:outer membrane protein assembly factor BamB